MSYAGLLAGRGVVVVDHGDLRTTYEPVTASVTVGQLVDAGAAIGVLEPGHDSCPVSACLHWGLRRGETYLDPVRLVEAGPVRLLPRDDNAPADPTGSAGRTGAAPAGAGVATAASSWAGAEDADGFDRDTTGAVAPAAATSRTDGPAVRRPASDAAPGRRGAQALTAVGALALVGRSVRPRRGR